MGVTAGEAIPLQWVVFMVKWGFFPCFVVLTYHSAECAPDGYAYYSWWCWGALVPVQLACLGLEFICHRYICVPKYQVLRRFTVFNVEVRYAVWFGASLLMSALHSCNFAADSAFLGTFLRSQTCDGSDERQELWRYIVGSSFAGVIAKFVPDLQTMVILSWAASFLQLAYVLLESVPLCRDIMDVDYEVATANPNGGYKTQYATTLHQTVLQNHGSALFALADCNGAFLLISEELHFASMKAEMQHVAHQSKDSFPFYIKHVMDQVSRGVFRTLLAGALSNGWQLNLQITIFTIRWAMHPRMARTVVAQSVLALALGLLGLTHSTIDGCKRVRFARTWQRRLPDMIGRLRSEEDVAAAKSTRSQLLLYTVALAACTVICAGMCLYAMAKLLLSLTCENTVWNIHGCMARDWKRDA